MKKLFLPHLIFCLTTATSALAAPTIDAQKEEILFGSTMTLTGSNAPFAKQCLNGATMAMDEINASGGISGRKLKILVEDFGELDLKRAASAAHFLLEKNNLVAMLPIWHEDTEVVAPIAERKGRITMTLGAGGPRVTRFSPSTFRATMSDSKLAAKLVEDQRALGAKKACILSADSSYYVDIVKDIAASWSSSGGDVVLNETLPYVPGETRSLVTRLKRYSCDVIFVWAAPPGLPLLIREMQVQKVEGVRALPWFAATAEVLQATEGDSSAFTLYRYKITDADFIARYTARSKEAPMRPAGNCYDGIRVLAKVMNEVGTDRDQVRQALLGLEHYQGVTGPFVVTADRERIGEDIERMQIVNGKLSAVDPITADPITADQKTAPEKRE